MENFDSTQKIPLKLNNLNFILESKEINGNLFEIKLINYDNELIGVYFHLVSALNIHTIKNQLIAYFDAPNITGHYLYLFKNTYQNDYPIIFNDNTYLERNDISDNLKFFAILHYLNEKVSINNIKLTKYYENYFKLRRTNKDNIKIITNFTNTIYEPEYYSFYSRLNNEQIKLLDNTEYRLFIIKLLFYLNDEDGEDKFANYSIDNTLPLLLLEKFKTNESINNLLNIPNNSIFTEYCSRLKYHALLNIVLNDTFRSSHYYKGVAAIFFYEDMVKMTINEDIINKNLIKNMLRVINMTEDIMDDFIKNYDKDYDGIPLCLKFKYVETFSTMERNSLPSEYLREHKTTTGELSTHKIFNDTNLTLNFIYYNLAAYKTPEQLLKLFDDLYSSNYKFNDKNWIKYINNIKEYCDYPVSWFAPLIKNEEEY